MQQGLFNVRIAYLDCATGISGDMMVAALVDAGVEFEALEEVVASLQLDGVSIAIEEVMRGGFRGKKLHITHPEQHAHRHLSDIRQILSRSNILSDEQRALAMSIFEEVARAEAQVHGSTPEKIHFHEVGAIDSILDITLAAVGFDLLDVDDIVSSPIPTGSGSVTIAHGVCAVPTPGTAELLKGIPTAQVPIEAELTTPTGAAIVRALVSRFSKTLPAMTVESIGYGAGTKEFRDRANLLRLVVGEVTPSPQIEEVILLQTNLDDVSPEIIGHTCEVLIDAGALDVYTTPIQMKKGRPGVMLSVLCDHEYVDDLEARLFAETGTLGIRRQTIERSVRERNTYTVETDWGPIEGKLAWREGESITFKPEYEDCARVAEEQQVPLREVYRVAEASFLLEASEGLDIEGMELHDHDHDEDGNCVHDHDHDDDHHHHDHDHGHDHDHDHG